MTRRGFLKERIHIVAFLLCALSYTFLIPTGDFCFALDKEGNDNAIAIYNKNRQSVSDEKKSADQSFKNEVALLQAEIAKENQNITETTQKIADAESIVAQNDTTIKSLISTQQRACSLLFPLFSAVSIMESFFVGSRISPLALVCLSITVLNVFLFIYYKHNALFQRRKTTIIVTAIILSLSIASPLFAADQTKRDQVISKLDITEKMLSKSDYERFIAILEEKPMDLIKIPELQSGDPLFKIYQSVTVDSPEYWFSLAALYTHEKQNGKAIDAVKKTVVSNRLLANKDHQHIIINCFKYLLQEKQTQIISSTVESIGGTSLEVPTSLELATLFKENGMQTSADKTLSYAISKASSVADLVHLANYFIDRREFDKSNEALEKARARVKTKNDILVLIEKALIIGKNDFITRMIATVDTTLSQLAEKVEVVDLLIKHGRKEEATALVGKMIKSDMPKSDETTRKLLFLIDASLQRNFIPQASDATEKLILMLGGFANAKNFPMKDQQQLGSATGIPDTGRIMLPQFYGLTKEEQGRNDEAEDAYIRAVLESLTTIIMSYGYSLPESLNDFYLLGRIWTKSNRNDLINQLDRVYSIIEKQFIKNQNEKYQIQLNTLRDEVNSLKNNSQKEQANLNSAKWSATKSYIKLIVHAGSTISTILLLLIACFGCIVLAHKHSKKLSMGKTFGFFMKLSEAVGWLQIFSILGAITGFLLVLFSQFFLIFQMVQENTHRIAAFPSPSPLTDWEPPKPDRVL